MRGCCCARVQRVRATAGPQRVAASRSQSGQSAGRVRCCKMLPSSPSCWLPKWPGAALTVLGSRSIRRAPPIISPLGPSKRSAPVQIVGRYSDLVGNGWPTGKENEPGYCLLLPMSIQLSVREDQFLAPRGSPVLRWVKRFGWQITAVSEWPVDLVRNRGRNDGSKK